MDTTTGELSVQRQTTGQQAAIDLDSPPIVPGSVVVGKFHTPESHIGRLVSGVKPSRPNC
jgi:hypothetical protein